MKQETKNKLIELLTYYADPNTYTDHGYGCESSYDVVWDEGQTAKEVIKLLVEDGFMEKLPPMPRRRNIY